MKKPSILRPGDTVATVSLSWGGAGEPVIRDRYEKAKKRLTEEFGLNVIEMPHTLKGSAHVFAHPEERAKDWMAALEDPTIKGVFSCIGGEDSIRLLPYIDLDVIANNPKVFLGYSDSTVSHLLCYQAGVTSFYGPSMLMEFGENVAMHDYTVQSVRDNLFQDKALGVIEPSPKWTSERLEWTVKENNDTLRTMQTEAHGIECLQGSGQVQGHMLGGCIEVLDMVRGTSIWPSLDQWKGAILFLETSEDCTPPGAITAMLRSMVATGAIDQINGIIWSKPLEETHYEAYKEVIRQVIAVEAGRPDLPILYNLNFGHTSPMFTIPMGVAGQIDCDKKTFSLLEAGTSL